MDDEHALTRGRHRRRRPLECVCDGRVDGYEQPAAERMVIPIRVVGDLAPVLHGVCLGRVRALVIVDPARPAIEVESVHQPTDDEKRCQQSQTPPVAGQPAGDTRSGDGNAVPGCPAGPRSTAVGDSARGRDRQRGRGHETPLSSAVPGITTWWAPTCVVFSHWTLPWSSRTIARSAAADRTS